MKVSYPITRVTARLACLATLETEQSVAEIGLVTAWRFNSRGQQEAVGSIWSKSSRILRHILD